MTSAPTDRPGRDTWVLAALTLCVTVVAISMVRLGRASSLEGVAFVAGALCVWLVVKESIWNFPIGIVNTAGYSVVFFQARLYGDAFLNVLYCILAIIGWYLWLHGGKQRSALRISRTGRMELGLVILGMALGTLLLWKVLHSVGGSASFGDALTTSLSLGAQWLMNRKKVESWHVWIATDIIYVPLYITRGLHLTAVLYAVFLVMAVMGLLRWRRVYLDQAAEAAPGP